MVLKLSFEIAGGDFNHAGKASSHVKKMLKQLNIDSKIIKRTVVAIYEAEMNVVAHANHGILHVDIGNDRLKVTLADTGPGIDDIEKAMQEGFSTASKKVREMGFGAGMGLPNIKKNTDFFEITSVPGEGTRLFFYINY